MMGTAAENDKKQLACVGDTVARAAKFGTNESDVEFDKI